MDVGLNISIQFEMSSHHSIVLNLLIWSLTLLLCFLLQNVLVSYRWFYIPSSIFVVGFCFLSGWLLSTVFKPSNDWTRDEGRMFVADAFYYIMLPIIIFNAGYHLNMKVFKKNLDGILTIALVGTWLNILLLSTLLFSAMHFIPYVSQQLISLNYMECVAFSAILSSTDPVSTLSIFSSLQVNQDLFYLVLGESLINDAVAISIFNAASYLIQNLPAPTNPQNVVSMYAYYFGTWLLQLLVVFVLSGLLGYVMCLLVAWMCKRLNFDNDHMSPLVCCMLVGYIAFYLAEVFHLSGVIACFSAAVNIRRFFIALSLDKAGSASVSYCIECIGYSAETASMALLGFALILITVQDIKLYLMLALLGACLVVRFVASFSLLALVNLVRYLRNRQRLNNYEQVYSPSRLPQTGLQNASEQVPYIPAKHMTMLWMSGLRGALNLALATYFPGASNNQDAVYTATLVFVIGTILLFGGLTVPAIWCLKIDMHSSAAHIDEESHSADCLTSWEDRYIVGPYLRRPQQDVPVASFSREERRRNSSGVHSVCCLGME